MRRQTMWNAGTALVALVALWLPAQSVRAEEPVETAVKAWVAQVDASPDWRASYGSLAVDPASGRATLTDLSVEAEKPGFAIKAGSVTIDGFQPGGGATFSAIAVTLDNAEIDAGAYAVHIDHAALNGPVLPTDGSFVWDDADPFASAIKALEPLTRASAAGGSIGLLTVTETIGRVSTTTSYRNVAVQGVQQGKIAAITAGPLRTDSPTPDPTATPALPPVVTLTAASAETRDLDLGAILAVLDRDRYAGGVGDGVWRTAVGHFVYRTVGIDALGIDVTIGGMSVDDFRMRQPKGPPADTAPADAATAGVVPDLLHTLRTLSAYGVGRFALHDFDIDTLHLGDLTITDASTDAIGSFTAEDMRGDVRDQGTVKIGRLAFGGLTLPPIAAIEAAANAWGAGGDVDYSSLVPPLGFLELAGVDVAVSSLPPVQLGRFRVDLGKYVDKVPTAIAATLAGADVPASLIPSDRAQKLLSDFSYDRLAADGSASIDWSAAGDIGLRNLNLAIKGIGAISGEADLTGLTPADAEHMSAVTGALDKLALKRGTLTFKDDSIVGRVLSAQATRLNTDPAKFRDQFATGLPFMLMFLGDRALQAKLAPVLQTFIRTPGSITVTATPASPPSLAAIVTAAETAPFSLFGLLSVTISGVAGPAPPAPAPVPASTDAIRPTLPPAN